MLACEEEEEEAEGQGVALALSLSLPISSSCSPEASEEEADLRCKVPFTSSLYPLLHDSGPLSLS